MPVGRPRIITSGLVRRIVASISAGCYAETAAAEAGISKDTYYRWLREGARLRLDDPETLTEDEELLAALSEEVEQAHARAELRDVLRIDKAIDAGAWQAAAWRLERKYAERWGRRDQLALSGRIDSANVHAHVQAGGAATLLQDETACNLACDLLERLAGTRGGSAAIQSISPSSSDAPTSSA